LEELASKGVNAFALIMQPLKLEGATGSPSRQPQYIESSRTLACVSRIGKMGELVAIVRGCRRWPRLFLDQISGLLWAGYSGWH
jgi:hypothetical protein